MKDGGDDQSGSKEMDFTSEGGEGEPKSAADHQHVAQEDPPASDKYSAPAEIDKENSNSSFSINARSLMRSSSLMVLLISLHCFSNGR